MSYETIIIGAGLSGLAAGIRLAYFDRPVCIVEQHTTIGGLNSFYRLRGRNHDVGLHAVTNYAPPGTKTGPLSKLLRQLRLRWDDFDLRPQLESRIVFPGARLRFTNDIELLNAEIAERFPRQIDGFRRLTLRIDEQDALNSDRQPISGRAVVGEYLSDPLLVEMLFCPLMFYGSATPGDMDFNQFAIMFRSIFQEGFARPAAGIRPILKSLVRKFKSLGGELRLRSAVREIFIENGRTVGVVLEDGEVLETRHVLSSAGSAETMKLCPHNADPALLPSPGNISFVETIFSLDRPPVELGHETTILFYNDSPRFRYECPGAPVDLRSGIVCSPNNFDYDQPLSEGRLRITALANPDDWFPLSEEDYAAEKTRWCARIVESALRYVPEFRSAIVDTDVFTPRTIRKFTGHINGCVYGAPQKALDGRTPVENLYLCGTDQGFVGIIGTMLSGISIANRYLLG